MIGYSPEISIDSCSVVAIFTCSPLYSRHMPCSAHNPLALGQRAPGRLGLKLEAEPIDALSILLDTLLLLDRRGLPLSIVLVRSYLQALT